MTEIEAAVAALTTPSTPTGAETVAARCGELLAVLGRAHRAAISGNVSIADRYVRRVSEHPAAALADLMTSIGLVLPKLDGRNQGSWHRQAIADAVNGLAIPVSFGPAQRAAFLVSYLFASGQMRSRKRDETAIPRPAEAPAAGEPAPEAAPETAGVA